MHIVLVGDSIFDNALYVETGAAVEQLLQDSLPNAKVSLLAVDGDVTTDVASRLNRFPSEASHVFVSCGGNDALGLYDLLDSNINSLFDALMLLSAARETFRLNYQKMLETILKRHRNVYICTIYNKLPTLSAAGITMLALFNEVIIEEAVLSHLPVIDLRVICGEAGDFSDISPIEPSMQGGQKIVDAIRYLAMDPDLPSQSRAIPIVGG
jgi:lysophospholipase L1-like esterase